MKPKFYVINFDDPRRSHRCNPIHPDFMEDITDAYESAYTIMLNLNKTWVQKQGDFFVESPIILFASIIWYLKIYQGGKYCTFPHALFFQLSSILFEFLIMTLLCSFAMSTAMNKHCFINLPDFCILFSSFLQILWCVLTIDTKFHTCT